MQLTGRWRGHYEQDGGRHGIDMQIWQTGASFRGRMRDEDTLMMGGLDPAEAQEIRERLAPDATTDPELIMSVPADSTILGELEERRVQFVKIYHGPQTSQLWIDDVHVHIELPGHRVNYAGTLDPTGDVMRGEWWIVPRGQPDADPDDPDPDDAEPEEEERGAFELRRVAE